MHYRKLGNTGLNISVLSLGGHWKGLEPVLGRPFHGSGYDDQDLENIRRPDFLRNRDAVLSCASELGINYIDACSPPEILAYAKLLEGRRDRFYFGYSWHTREPRYPEWRSPEKLLAGLDQGLHESGLDYVDLWRLSLPADGVADPSERERIEQAVVEGLALARRRGKARATGVSSHDRTWLRSMVEKYPEQIEVVLFPFPPASQPASSDSLFDTLRARQTGAAAIKPFGGGSLFRDDGLDDRRAALAIRHLLAQPGITAAVAGFASVAQLKNAALAAECAAPLTADERAELEASAAHMRLHLSWLRNWEFV